MIWDNAKTMLIIFLLGLNIFLGAMYFMHEDNYAVSREDVQIITSILAQNNITLDARVEIPRSFPPVDQLQLRPAIYNTTRLINAFFIDTSNISQTIEFGNTIFSSPEGTLTVMRHIVLFEPAENSPHPLFSMTTHNLNPHAPAFAQFLQAHPVLFPGFSFDHMMYTDGGNIVVEYRQIYMGYKVHANVLSFNISPEGVTTVRYIYYPPADFLGVRQPIISAVQALFMFKLGNAHIDEPITITDIDLVHNIVFADDGSGRITTVPYYRIFNSHGEPMLINAITGDIE